MNINSSRALGRAGTLGLCIAAVIAQAQETPPSASPQAQSTAESGSQLEASPQLEEVVVTGYRGSLEQSLEQKRASVNFVDSISAEDVGKLPDNNLAEALQRVPGVQISRTNGEGQQISLRGLGPSFARVLLDGMPISVASEGSVDQQARNREFDFDLLPSEIFSRIEVSKTPRAGEVEGGLAGTVNLRAPRPFDYQGFKASYQLQGAYSSSSEELDPRGSFLISNNWDDTFGALISVSMSERTYRTDGWSSQGWTVAAVPGNPPAPGYNGGSTAWNLPSVAANVANRAPGFVNESGLTNAQLADAQVPRLGRPELQLGNRDRMGVTAALQWRPTDTLSFNLDGIWAELDAEFDRYTNNLLFRNTSSTTNTPTGFGFVTPRNFVLDTNNTMISGTLDGAKFWSENRIFHNETEFYSVGLGGTWQASDRLSVELKLARSESDWKLRHTTYLFLSRPGTVSITTGGGIPAITPSLDLTDPANWAMDTVRVQPRKRDEENESAALNVTFGDAENNIQGGLLYNTFYRNRLSYSASIGVTQGTMLQPYGFTGSANLAAFNIAPFSRTVPVNFGEYFDDSSGYSRWLVADMRAFGGMLDEDRMDREANLDFQNSGSFEEKNSAAYLEANGAFDLGGRTLRVNGGVRYVKTEQEMIGYLRIPSTPAPGPQFGLGESAYGRNTLEGEYSKVLPSVNLAYDLTDSLVSRFAVSRSLSRPNPADLQPFTNFTTAGVVNQGNPNLKPYISDQLDGGVEWYFSQGSVLAGNLFYKEITGFVERRNVPQPFRNANVPLETITDPTLLALLPQGLDTILLFNTPVNIAATTYLKGLEVFYQQRLDMLLPGMGVNFNFTRLDSGRQVIIGLAENNYNAVGYWETDRYAVRLSYNYRDDYVECPVNCGSTSPEVGYRKEAGYLDLSSSVSFQAFDQDLTVSFEALNLTDEEEYSFYGFENRANTLNQPGRQYILGIRGAF